MTNDELKNLLRNYQHERATLADMLKQMAKECDAVFYPSDTGYDKDPIQKQYDQSNQIDLILSQCDEERKLVRDTLMEIKDRTNTLDLLMYNLLKLNGYQRYILIKTSMHDWTTQAVSIELNRAEDTIKSHKQSAMDKLLKLMNTERIRTD